MITPELIANLRKTYSDQDLIKAYALNLRNERRPRSHSGPIQGWSIKALVGRKVAEDSGITEDQALQTLGG